LFGVERSFFAGDALDDQARILIYENAHLMNAQSRLLDIEVIESDCAV
jgi:hypothetical protein